MASPLSGRKTTLSTRVNQYGKDILIVKSNKLFCKICNKELGDQNIRKHQIDQHLQTAIHTRTSERSND